MTGEHMPSEERLRDLLMWKKVVKAEMTPDAPDDGMDPTGYLTLSDGMVLKVYGNEGGCSCGAGDYALTELNTVDNAITNVEVEEAPGGDDEESYEGSYRIFVFAEDRRLPLATFDGSDGNGYYGTGWWLQVVKETA